MLIRTATLDDLEAISAVEADLTDDMYKNAQLHDENGEWQMIFGVNTLPSYRRHGGVLWNQMRLTF